MKVIKRMDPIKGLMIIVMISLGFNAISIGITNLISFNTNQLIQSNDETNAILDAINDTQTIIEMTRQNQTQVILNQTHSALDNQEEIIDNQEIMLLLRNMT